MPARLAAVLAAKAAGAAHLDELTAGPGSGAFVLFSSAAATFGGAGQGNYAAANAFLDALAQQRAGRGLAGLSVAWGPWAAAGWPRPARRCGSGCARGPLPEMDPAWRKALAQALDGPDSALAVMDVDWAQFAAHPGAVPPGPARRRAAPATTGRRGGACRPAASWRGGWPGLPGPGRSRCWPTWSGPGPPAVLGHASAEAIEADRAFGDLGFDSLTSLEMRQHLAAVTGLKLPATLLFDYPTPAVLAEYLRAEAFAAESRPPAGAGRTRPARGPALLDRPAMTRTDPRSRPGSKP